MSAYANKSLEELRCEDYVKGVCLSRTLCTPLRLVDEPNHITDRGFLVYNGTMYLPALGDVI